MVVWNKIKRKRTKRSINQSAVPFLLEPWSQVNSDGRSGPSWGRCDWVWVHCVDVVVRVVHYNHLRVSGFTSGSGIPPNQFWCNLAVVRSEMIRKTALVIVVCLPDHSLLSRMGLVVFPVLVIVHIQLCLRIFDKSVCVIDAGADAQIYRACSVSGVQGVKSIIDCFGKLQNVPQSVCPWLPESGHCAWGSTSQSFRDANLCRRVSRQTSQKSNPSNVCKRYRPFFIGMVNSDHWEFRNGCVLLPVQSSELNELTSLSGRSPPASNTAWSFQKFRNQVDSSPSSNWNSRSFCDSFHFVFPSLRSVLFGNDVI